MQQAESAPSTELSGVTATVPAHEWSGRPAYRIDVLDLADRLNDIAYRLDVARLAIEGARAIRSTEELAAVAAFVLDTRDEIKAASDVVHPDPHERGDEEVSS